MAVAKKPGSGSETLVRILTSFFVDAGTAKKSKEEELRPGLKMNPHSGLPYSPRYFELFRWGKFKFLPYLENLQL